MPGNEEPKNPRNFEAKIQVRMLDQNTWEGLYPLRLPLPGARGVYGGHTCSQTLLVAMESAPGYIPHSFHSNFLKAGDSRVKCLYKVTRLNDGETICQRQINVYQKDNVIYTAMCSLMKKAALVGQCISGFGYVPAIPVSKEISKDPNTLYKTYHTDNIVNAYSDNFLKYDLCPEEKEIPPSERWLGLWSKLHQPGKERMDDPKFNFVGLAYLSDSAILTTLARALHLEWNPTIDNPMEEYDENKDARSLIDLSLNVMHIYHYNAMSLDHHVYFHLHDFDQVNILQDWLFLTYQFRVSKNSRTLVRGHFFDKDKNCIATFIQEGLTFMKPGVPGISGKKFSKFSKI